MKKQYEKWLQMTAKELVPIMIALCEKIECLEAELAKLKKARPSQR